MKLILDLIAPNNCVGCEAEGSLLCLDCQTKLTAIESSCFICSAPTANHHTCNKCAQNTTLTTVNVLSSYDGLIKDIVYKMKFERSKDAGKKLANLLWQEFGDEIAGKDLITHVPTATKRVRTRGYDQSRIIAKELSRLSGVEYKRLLSRLDQNRSTGKTKADRQKKQKYRLTDDVKNKKILLVDDIITTGNTLTTASSYLDKSNQLTAIAVAKVTLQ